MPVPAETFCVSVRGARRLTDWSLFDAEVSCQRRSCPNSQTHGAGDGATTTSALSLFSAKVPPATLAATVLTGCLCGPVPCRQP